MKRRNQTEAIAHGEAPASGAHVPRLFLDVPLGVGIEVGLGREQVHRLVNVMRRSEGDRVLVFNGREGEWAGELAQVSKKAAVLELREQVRPQPATPGITLAFAPLKHARLDYVAQKAAEMGVARIVPVLTRHTVAGRLNVERFRANVVEGAEQCGVLWIAEVAELVSLDRFMAGRGAAPGSAGPLVFCDEAAESVSPLDTLCSLTTPLTVLIGPEGGFSRDEREALRALDGSVPISLGPRIMRADTAIVAALALVQASCGDWR
ncbi:MAG: 16S rRNA (uracil(1498)-N(3))-methyltransferase [Rhodobiaceae bacterium]|nr:16S rRNA (uracil(1498)-N(3))-methyltransferase [Rhodobiaceae bacterium]